MKRLPTSVPAAFVALLGGALLLGFGVVSCSRTSIRFARFNATELAAAETRMWKAYYGGDPATLHQELAAVLGAQFSLPVEAARTIAQDFAEAAAKFAVTNEGYDQNVLPGLESGYRQLKATLDLPFDPGETARAELAWWVARRTAGQDSAEQVGGRIAELYASIYGPPASRYLKAGVLRAQAAGLRDAGGSNCDWAAVERLLGRSYSALASAL